ncbi:hypothetical protein B0T26DRAFT_699042 [Lasiosphaeria miniovina]|uniref:Uncharacterized protein n=1 Tax=Lasiosphaeria miniovina TaxID=1954250 RepID=A0AA40B7C8_9PEZI|nr:uncharacterized protein B0T26DRAFT_699042 [Lasiosphaeria miniovina]KAK0728708.1 hypothetical protein B0T26DRAFT_699042 [Lasiosphaeria miniovina]
MRMMSTTFRNGEAGFRIWFKEFIESLRGSWPLLIVTNRGLEEFRAQQNGPQPNEAMDGASGQPVDGATLSQHRSRRSPERPKEVKTDSAPEQPTTRLCPARRVLANLLSRPSGT